MSGYLQGRGIHVDQHLTNIAINYKPLGFIADAVAPIVPVMHQSGMFKTYNQADLFRIENDHRSPGTEANKVAFQVGSGSYFAKNYALKADVTIEDRANADPAFFRDLESGRVEFLKDKLALAKDLRVATLMTTATNVATQTAVASAWNDLTNSDPFGDINSVIDLQEDKTGYRPNKLVFSSIAFRNVTRNASIIDKTNKTGTTGGGQNATINQLKELFNVPEILVGGAQYNTGDEGQGLTLSHMWAENVFVGYVAERPSIDRPSFMYSFRWRKPGLANMNVERHPFDTKTKTDEIELGYYQDERLVSADLGYLISWVNCSQ